VGAARMEDKYSEELALLLRPSRIACAFIAAGALATLALAWATPLPIAVRILWSTAVACLALHAFERARLAHRVQLRRDGAARIDGREGLLRDGAFVAAFLATIRWRPAGARFDRTVLVLPDMLAPDDFRRLRVLLRWR
jgi:toxin CptA